MNGRRSSLLDVAASVRPGRAGPSHIHLKQDLRPAAAEGHFPDNLYNPVRLGLFFLDQGSHYILFDRHDLDFNAGVQDPHINNEFTSKSLH